MEKSVIFKNANIVYYTYEFDKKETIVLLHGFIENSTMWDLFIEPFSDLYNIVLIDLLGHGKTDCLGYIHTMESMADAVFEVLKTENISTATFIGHSMGGYVALAFVEKYRDYVNGLCLLNSTSKADSDERKKVRDRAILMAKTNYEPLISMSINNLFSQETNMLFEEEIKNCKNQALKTSVQGYIACAEGMKLRTNREHVLALFTGSKLLITGKKDPVINYQAILEEAKRTNTPIKTLSNGHMSHVENAQQLLDLLIDFLRNK